MTAQINAEHLFFKSQPGFFRKVPDVGQRIFIALLFFRLHKIEQGHLARYGFLCFKGNLFEHTGIDGHELLAGSLEAVAGTGMDQVLNRPFIHVPSVCPLQEIPEGEIRTLPFAFCHERIDDAPAHGFDRVHAAADAQMRPVLPFLRLRREASFPFIDGGGQDPDVQRPAVHQVLCAL